MVTPPHQHQQHHREHHPQQFRRRHGPPDAIHAEEHRHHQHQSTPQQQRAGEGDQGRQGAVAQGRVEGGCVDIQPAEGVGRGAGREAVGGRGRPEEVSGLVTVGEVGCRSETKDRAQVSSVLS